MTHFSLVAEAAAMTRNLTLQDSLSFSTIIDVLCELSNHIEMPSLGAFQNSDDGESTF